MTPHLITTPDAAEILGSPDLARLLKPFLRGPKTVSQAAREVNLSVEAMHYRTQRFLKAGLLRVAGELPRRGRPSKRYEAVSTDFLFASSLLAPETLRALEAGETWYAEIIEALDRLGARQYPDQVRVSLTADGALMWGREWLDPERQREAEQRQADLPMLYTHTAALCLTPADARALADELMGLFHRYHGRGGPKRYGMILGLTPLTRPVD